MSTNNIIKSFTAADIEKYHKGQLSTIEMNEIEKAALEDPFLADAIEGYTVSGVNVNNDLSDLKNRLKQKNEPGKVVPLYGKTKKAFPWVRVAAAVFIIGGAGVLANRILFKSDTKEEIAKVSVKESPAIPLTDSITNDVAGNINELEKNNSSSKEKIPLDNNATISTTIADGKSSIKITEPTANSNDKADMVFTEEKMAADELENKKETKDAPAVAPGSVETTKETKNEVDKQKGIFNNTGYNNGDILPTNQRVASAPVKRESNDNTYKKRTDNQYLTKLFTGRITDAGNTGLPFAKVFNPTDNDAGTYTDANGYFSLTYPDTVLNVQVRAIGFQNALVRLQATQNANRIVMQDDRSLSEVVVSNKKPNLAQRSGSMNRKLEEPEPADGWDKYDTYLANNIEEPEEIKTIEKKSGGSVQVSFEVDKNGDPINITVEKSLCTKCDKEAIRLIKEGPKWKRTASNKHGRTTVTINF